MPCDAPNLLGTTSTEDLFPTISSPTAATIQRISRRTTQASAQAQSKETTQAAPDCTIRPQPAADSLLSTPSAMIAEKLAAQTQSNDTQRIQNITRAIKALKTADALPLEYYEKLWSAREELFIRNESGLRG